MYVLISTAHVCIPYFVAAMLYTLYMCIIVAGLQVQPEEDGGSSTG